nr:hypothetical protein BgiMline_010106 [Biomphalaria glabrata]
MSEQINRMGNKVDESVLQAEGLIDQFERMVTQAQGSIDSLVKETLLGQDCGCTDSGDRDDENVSAVCVCVVGKSCGCDFQDEKRDIVVLRR